MTDSPPRISTRHGFLAALHALLQPKTYLEIGVQHGTSLALAHAAAVAIGVDPHPLVGPEGNQTIFGMTSDEYFERVHARDAKPIVDLGFIDGMHLVEYAWRDFVGVEGLCHPGSVVVFDDVLPRNLHEARRIPVGEPVVGDWTGDVWKVFSLLRLFRPGLTVRLVDVFPTGIMLVTGFPDPASLTHPETEFATSLEEIIDLEGVPPAVLARTAALTPLVALHAIRQEIAER